MGLKIQQLIEKVIIDCPPWAVFLNPIETAPYSVPCRLCVTVSPERSVANEQVNIGIFHLLCLYESCCCSDLLTRNFCGNCFSIIVHIKADNVSELLCNSHFKLQANLVASGRFLRRINVSVCDLSLHKQYKVLVHLHTNEVIVSIIFIFCEQRKCFSRATSHAALFQNRIPLSQLRRSTYREKRSLHDCRTGFAAAYLVHTEL